MRRGLIYLMLLCAADVAASEVPPLRAPVGEMVEGIACASDPSQTYTLYLPPGFTNDRRWPVLLVFDPRGRSVLAAEVFREAADDYGWIIVSSNDTRSDGPMEPNLKALKALWPEVHTRLPADFKRIYATGFSGGVAVAFILAKQTNEVAGVIGSGGRFFPENLRGPGQPVFSAVGNTGFNFGEMHKVDEFLAVQGNPHRLVVFEGPHTWMPARVAREGVEWMEVIAMKSGLRTRDSELVEALFSADFAVADEHASDGRLLEAVRRYREIEETYEGLHTMDAVRVAAAQLEASSEYRKRKKEMKRAKSLEIDCRGQRNRVMSVLRNSEISPSVRQLALDLEIAELKRRAEGSGAVGMAAQRCLNGLYTGLSFYLPRDALKEGRYATVATSYELALMIHPDNPIVWYNLACARARLGHEDSAMEALEEALDLGFDRFDLLATDSDLDPLRDRDDFRATVP
jgi:tetratricopeptide (TPR) repeat protein